MKFCFTFTSASTPSLSIEYVSQDKVVLYNSNFSIYCGTKSHKEAKVSIFKQSSDTKQEFKLKSSINFVSITETAVTSGLYICEAEFGYVRAKEEIRVTVYGKLEVSIYKLS